MPNTGAGGNLQRPTAHPRLEGQLEVLGSPDVQTRIVFPEFVEVVTGDCEQSAGDRRGSNHCSWVSFASLHLVVWNHSPLELEIPREPASDRVRRPFVAEVHGV